MSAPVKLAGLSLVAVLTIGATGNNFTVLGEGAARQCFEAAEGLSPIADGVAICTKALNEDMLSPEVEASTYANRGAVWLSRGQFAAARRDLEAAIASPSAPAEAYSNMGFLTLRTGGDWKQAKPLFDEALSRNMHRPAAAWYGRAIAHELGGNFRAAYNDYRRASQLEPKWQEPREQLRRFSVRRA